MNKINTLQDLSNWTKSLPNTDTMPVLFAGHGSPMNAIEDNKFSREWRKIGQNLEKPTAILCISAHWLTSNTTAVTAMSEPRTIHDFGGFPQALFDVQYPVTGNKALVEDTIAAINSITVHEDHAWGLDHGTWSVLVHMFPDADVPVVQLSIDYNKNAEWHYSLAKELAVLRQKGVLIIASGNMIHNLRMIVWDKMTVPDYGYDWALDVDAKMQDYLLTHRHENLIDWEKQGQAFRLAIPTPDHYYPMLYALGLQSENDQLVLFNAGTTAGSLSMTSFMLHS